MRRRWIVGMLVAVLCVSTGVVSGKDNKWKKELQDKLTETYKLSKMAVFNYTITEPGTVLVVTKEGIIGYLGTDITIYPNKLKDGAVVDPPPRKDSSRQLKPGETLYLLDFDVRDNMLRVTAVTTETVQRVEKGTTKDRRYKVIIDFQFSADLQIASFTDVKNQIDTFLKTEAEYKRVAAEAVPAERP